MTEDNLADSKTPTEEEIEHYREYGFVRIRNIISANEVETYHEAALAFQRKKLRETEAKTGGRSVVFNQFVNTWREEESLKPLTLHRNVASVAERVAYVIIYMDRTAI